MPKPSILEGNDRIPAHIWFEAKRRVRTPGYERLRRIARRRRRFDIAWRVLMWALLINAAWQIGSRLW